MNAISLLTGLRFVDSFFPSGSYAFSSGLEAAVQGGQARTVEEFARYVKDLLDGSISRREAVAVARAWEAQAGCAVTAAMDTDHELDSMILCSEIRAASRQMGRQVIRNAAEGRMGAAMLREFCTMVDNELTPGHFPVCIGLTLGVAGWGRADTVAAFLYQTAVSFVSAGMKLLPLGQRDGQRLLNLWTPWIAQVADNIKPDDPLCGWSPVQEIYAMRHARLESRLFRS